MFHVIDDELIVEKTDARIAYLRTLTFLLSDDMDIKDIFPLHYTRQQVEQVFDIGKNNADLLQLHIQNENTFRGVSDAYLYSHGSSPRAATGYFIQTQER